MFSLPLMRIRCRGLAVQPKPIERVCDISNRLSSAAVFSVAGLERRLRPSPPCLGGHLAAEPNAFPASLAA